MPLRRMRHILNGAARYHLKKMYGITPEDFDRPMLLEPEGAMRYLSAS